MPFGCRFISQLLSKCDCSLSQESIRRVQYLECLVFLFASDHRHIFCSSWIRGISEKSRKEIYIACSKFVFKNLFPSSRCLTLKERKDIWPIRAWYQNLVSWNGGIRGMSTGSAAFPPSPDHRWARFSSRYFSYLFCFLPFPPTAEPGPRLIRGQIINNNRKKLMRVMFSHHETSDKNHTVCSVKMYTPPGRNLPITENIHWNKQHFGTR